MLRPFLIMTLAVSALVATAGGASAATYYISPSGNDTTGTGSSAAPWRSFEKAHSVAVAGDTVYVAAGTGTGPDYSDANDGEDDGTLQLAGRGGNSTAPVTWQGIGSRRPIVRGYFKVRASEDDLLGRHRFTNINFYGPNLPNSESGLGFAAFYGSVELDNCEVKGFAGSGVYFVSDAASSFRDNFYMHHCWVHDNGSAANLDHGVYVRSGTGRIENNVFQNNLAYGIHLFNASLSERPADVVINHNTVIDNNKGGICICGGTRGTRAYNNIVADVDKATTISGDTYGIVGGDRTNDPAGNDNRVGNNIVWNFTHAYGSAPGGTYITFEASNQIINPLLLENMDGLSQLADSNIKPRVEYSVDHYKGGSPAIDRGVTPAPLSTRDVDGGLRNSIPDIGAQEATVAASS